jgi:hypothetical protein
VQLVRETQRIASVLDRQADLDGVVQDVVHLRLRERGFDGLGRMLAQVREELAEREACESDEPKRKAAQVGGQELENQAQGASTMNYPIVNAGV